jgi:rhodanese-related sulfurtransferase
MTCQELESLLANKTSFTLIDCRQPWEHKLASIQHATLIPLGEFASYFEDIEVEPTLRVVVYCHHGVRSLQAAHYLRQLGFASAQSLAGGIDAWSMEIDPEVPRY